MNLLMIILAVVSVAVAAYAQTRIPRFTAGRAKTALTRSVLIVIGIAFGYVCSWPYAADRGAALLAFLIGFGAVHFPAAFILFVKRERGAGKS